MALNAPPIRSAIVDNTGNVTMPWAKWFQEAYNRIGAALGRSTTTIDADVSSLAADTGDRITALESGLVTEAARIADLEAGPVAPAFTVAGVPAAAGHPGKTILVTNESGGAVLAFSDGTAWRRVTDRAVIS